MPETETPLVRNIDFVTRKKICQRLNLTEVINNNNYINFAYAVGMSMVQVNVLSEKKDPTEIILSWWQVKNEATVDEMKVIMRRMTREDVYQILDEYSGATSCA